MAEEKQLRTFARRSDGATLVGEGVEGMARLRLPRGGVYTVPRPAAAFLTKPGQDFEPVDEPLPDDWPESGLEYPGPVPKRFRKPEA